MTFLDHFVIQQIIYYNFTSLYSVYISYQISHNSNNCIIINYYMNVWVDRDLVAREIHEIFIVYNTLEAFK